MPNVKLKKKKISSWTLMGVKINLRKTKGLRDQKEYWTLEINILDYEIIKGALWRVLEHVARDHWPTAKLYHVRTILTDKNKLLAVLKTPTSAES